MRRVEQEKRRVESERPQFRIPRLDDLRAVVDRQIVDNFARFYKLEGGEAGINEGIYVAMPLADQDLVLIFYQKAKSFVREGKFGEHKHWKYDSFRGSIPSASSTNQEKDKFERRVSRLKTRGEVIPADQINGRVLVDIQALVARKAG